MSKKEKIISGIVLGIYILFLCWLVLFKLADSIEKIPSMRSLNLIPFYYDCMVSTLFHVEEVIFNALIFIPVGFYFTSLSKAQKSRKLITGLLGSITLSMIFEISQLVFALGACDITDFITNTTGGLLGTSLFLILQKHYRGRQMRVINTIGIITEALLITVIIFLIILNK